MIDCELLAAPVTLTATESPARVCIVFDSEARSDAARRRREAA
jgi:hypothetical protein